MDLFEGFERWYDCINFKTVLRCQKCGAMDEIRDFEVAQAIHIRFEHDCRALPAETGQKEGLCPAKTPNLSLDSPETQPDALQEPKTKPGLV
jgi:hypothetical protein